jgi:type II secretory pathway pseudopilin PulG
MSKGSKKEKEGTTLIEIMLAILVLAFMATALPTALRHPRAMVVSSVQKQIALQAASEALELAKTWNPDDLGGGWATAAAALENRYGLYDQSIHISTDVRSAGLKITLVSVAVSFDGSDGNAVYLETLVYTP